MYNDGMKLTSDTDNFDFLMGSAPEVASRLLGCWLVRDAQSMDPEYPKAQLIGKIVETEAYDQTDSASHSFKGQTPSNQVLFGPPGHLYVYFTYGMHYCCNVVTGAVGQGAAVLIRAVEPLQGSDGMAINRPVSGVNLTNGPAKICQALAIDKALNGHNLGLEPLKLVIQPPIPAANIVQTTRIGISRAQDVPWRFYITGNAYVSRTISVEHPKRSAGTAP